MFLVSSSSCLCPIHCSQVLSLEWKRYQQVYCLLRCVLYHNFVKTIYINIHGNLCYSWQSLQLDITSYIFQEIVPARRFMISLPVNAMYAMVQAIHDAVQKKCPDAFGDMLVDMKLLVLFSGKYAALFCLTTSKLRWSYTGLLVF